MFDLFDNGGIILAASALCKMIDHLRTIEARCNDRPSLEESPDMFLDLDKYHLKPVSQFFSLYGQQKVDKSLARFFEITKTHLEETGLACCPLAYRIGDKLGEDAIVFKKLSGYSIGLPHESTDERRKLLDAIKKALSRFHQTGLVHMDLYLSNIMWCKDPSSGIYDVQFIDLDGLHFAGEIFSETMVHRLRQLGFSDTWITGGAQPSFDIHYFQLVEQHIDSIQLFWQPDQAATKICLDSFLQRQPISSPIDMEAEN